MQHYWSLDHLYLRNAWVTIGSFDGVHRGHQEIIKNLTAGAHQEKAPAVVLTFHPHPAEVLRKRRTPFYLTTPEERATLLNNLGVDVVITHPFSQEVANQSAHDFIASLHDHLQLSHLWVGYDFAIGRGREGNVPMLTQLGQEFGYKLHQIAPFTLDGEVVSSSQIRISLAAGDMERVTRLLGRPYSITGQVIHGDGRGRHIGMPTANLDVWPERALPEPGVYVSQVFVHGKRLGAVTNIGSRPTFEAQPVHPRIEAHILDYDKDLYGQEVQLSFIARLRDELRFPSAHALTDQISKDIQRAREIL